MTNFTQKKLEEFDEAFHLSLESEHSERDGTRRAKLKAFLSESIEQAYAEGAKDGEGTKNGSKRYLMGHADGTREERERINGHLMVIRERMDDWADNIWANEAKKELNKIIGELLNQDK